MKGRSAGFISDGGTDTHRDTANVCIPGGVRCDESELHSLPLLNRFLCESQSDDR